MTSAEVILRVQYGTVPVPVPYVLTRVIQDAQSRKSLARARVARARPRAGIPDPVNEFSGRFPENSRAAREFSYLQRLEKIVDWNSGTGTVPEFHMISN